MSRPRRVCTSNILVRTMTKKSSWNNLVFKKVSSFFLDIERIDPVQNIFDQSLVGSMTFWLLSVESSKKLLVCHHHQNDPPI